MSDDAPRIMWSISQIAERDGVSRQAVSKIVSTLVERHGIAVERDGRGRISLVSLAHYDHHRSQFSNPAKTVAPRSPTEIRSLAGDSFEEARRQNEWLKVERGKLQRQEELRALVRADKLNDAIEFAGREIQSVVSRLPNRADDLALAVSKEGVHGLRVLLRTVAYEMAEEIANKLAAAADVAPAGDPVISDDSEI